MSMNISADMRTCKGIAMAIAPFDTGNLKFNAIKSMATNRGFRIKYSLADAFYIYFLEEGTRFSNSHVGFISNDTVPTIASYLYAKYASRDVAKTNRFRYVARQASKNLEINEQRDIKNYQSRNLDLENVSLVNKWEHKEENEVFDPNFKERTI